MNQAAKLAALVRMCNPNLYTDVERVVQAWLCCDDFESVAEGINLLEQKLPGKEASILAASAMKELSDLHPDGLGICIGPRFDPEDYVPRSFIESLAKLSTNG